MKYSVDRYSSKTAACLAIVVVFLLGQLLGAVLGMLVPGAGMGAILFVAFSLTIVLAFALGIVHQSDISLSQLRRSDLSVGSGICMLLGIVLVCFAVNVFMEQLDLPDLLADQMKLVLSNPLGVATVAFIGPFAEECFFRAGLIGHMQRRGMEQRWAIVLSALLFGLVHGNPAQIPFAFVIGLALGYVYCRTRSIVLPVLAHVINNGAVVVSYWVMGEEADSLHMTDLLGGAVTGSIIACLLAIVGIWMIVRKKGRK